jgi:hypothetical protein
VQRLRSEPAKARCEHLNSDTMPVSTVWVPGLRHFKVRVNGVTTGVFITFRLPLGVHQNLIQNLRQHPQRCSPCAPPSAPRRSAPRPSPRPPAARWRW